MIIEFYLKIKSTTGHRSDVRRISASEFVTDLLFYLNEPISCLNNIPKRVMVDAQ